MALLAQRPTRQRASAWDEHWLFWCMRTGRPALKRRRAVTKKKRLTPSSGIQHYTLLEAVGGNNVL